MSTFPYFRLTAEDRKSLTDILVSLVYKTIDPTIESVQRAVMNKLYDASTDSETVVETAFGAVDNQINTLKTMSEKCTSDVTSRKLTSEYSNYISAINGCTRLVSQKFRDPISEFTRVHFVALPLMQKIVRDLNSCSSSFNINKIDTCVADFIKAYCQDESCKVNSVM